MAEALHYRFAMWKYKDQYVNFLAEHYITPDGEKYPQSHWRRKTKKQLQAIYIKFRLKIG